MNKPQTGIRFRSEMLGCSHIQRLAEYVAAEYGLPRVDRKRLRRIYAQATPIPITLENENGQLWVDKYYLAYRLLDGVTHYVYLSQTHIREEYRNYQARPHPAISASPCRWNTSGYFTRPASPCSWPGIRFGSRKNFLRKFLKNRLRRQK